MKNFGQIWIVLGLLASGAPALADEVAGQQYTAYPAVQLAELLDTVSKKSGRTFLTSANTPATVIVGQVRARDITYSSLLIVLFNNGLAAVTVGDVTSIVAAPRVRQHALPIILKDDDSIDDYEWVTRIVEVNNVHAPKLVPILRPLLPQMGHLVAESNSNTLVIAARYGNAKRLADIVKQIDARATKQAAD